MAGQSAKFNTYITDTGVVLINKAYLIDISSHFVQIWIENTHIVAKYGQDHRLLNKMSAMHFIISLNHFIEITMENMIAKLIFISIGTLICYGSAIFL